MTLSRRDFLKVTFAGAFSMALPIDVNKDVTIVDYDIVDGWWEDCATIVERKRFEMVVSLDMDKIWHYVILLDDQGRKWHTPDGGNKWISGLMEFELSDYE